ncbi:hypothetical protein [Flavobacterium gilvum]|uniref:hypothetical protein n=1 Tax=Flavobacterium gilvum TaxID=1492737 RepID=UPI0004E328F0|nr:hypothetical protein [Flavobacterium gilvum]KFC58782.1 hypothetical protein FEM08_24440 [Flavobacterium gilvum]
MKTEQEKRATINVSKTTKNLLSEAICVGRKKLSYNDFLIELCEKFLLEKKEMA